MNTQTTQTHTHLYILGQKHWACRQLFQYSQCYINICFHPESLQSRPTSGRSALIKKINNIWTWKFPPIWPNGGFKKVKGEKWVYAWENTQCAYEEAQRSSHLWVPQCKCAQTEVKLCFVWKMTSCLTNKSQEVAVTYMHIHFFLKVSHVWAKVLPQVHTVTETQ